VARQTGMTRGVEEAENRDETTIAPKRVGNADRKQDGHTEVVRDR